MSELWPSDRPGTRRAGTRQPKGYGRQTIKSDWVTPFVLFVFAALVIAGIGSAVAPFILESFQQVTDVLPTR